MLRFERRRRRRYRRICNIIGQRQLLTHGQTTDMAEADQVGQSLTHRKTLNLAATAAQAQHDCCSAQRACDHRILMNIRRPIVVVALQAKRSVIYAVRPPAKKCTSFG